MDEVKRGRGRPKKINNPDKPVPTKKPLPPTAFGQDMAEPGDNSKYLGHALVIARMPLIDLNDPQQVKERCDWYFEHCFQNDMKPTVSGLCSAFKISRTALLEWRRGTYRKDTHQAIILEAYALMENLWEDYMQNGKINPVSGIFLGKNNYGYSDKQEYVLTPNTGMPEAQDVAAIEAKYAELPED